ncbi:MAG: PilW family protein [Plesiomonas sp.]
MTRYRVSNISGFTLVEWMVAMVIALFLLGGVLSVFVVSRSSAEDALDQGELQQQGRVALHLISQDLKWAGFFGDYTGQPLQLGPSLSLSSGSTVAVSQDCLDERAIGSLPSSLGPIRSVWVNRVTATKGLNGLDCIPVNTRLPGTDVISIKRLVGRPIPSTEALDTNRFYMATSAQEARVIKGNEIRPLFGANNESQLWEYQHIVYHLASDNGVPMLRKRMLTANGDFLIGGAMAEGIERMVLLFGVDSSAVPDGAIDRYMNASSVTPQDWSEGRVLGARLFLLVRAAKESSRYKNTNTYQVGDLAPVTVNDGYRRLLLESSIALRNPQIVSRGGV